MKSTSLFISVLMLIAYTLPVAASPNPLSGLAGLLYLMTAVLTLGVFVLLCFAFKVKHKVGQFFLALPAMIWALISIFMLFQWDYSGFVFVNILFGLLLCTILTLLYFPGLKKNHPWTTVTVLVMSFLIAMVLNPAYTHLVGIQFVDNDPFDDKGRVVKEVIDAGYIYSDKHGQYRIDNYLLLENGDKIPGVFHGFRVGERVLVEKMYGAVYDYQVYGEVHHNTRLAKPVIHYPKKPLIQIKRPKNFISKPKGWGFDFE